MSRGRLRVSVTLSTPLHLNDEVENTSLGSQVPLEIDVTPCQTTTQGSSNASCNNLCYCIDYEQTTSPKNTNCVSYFVLQLLCPTGRKEVRINPLSSISFLRMVVLLR
jgi:hypothetical protein